MNGANERSETERFLWANFAMSKAGCFRALADLCRFAAAHPSDERFCSIIAQVHAMRVASIQQVAKIGWVTRTSANRWFNGESAPAFNKQVVVMQKLAELCDNLAREVS